MAPLAADRRALPGALLAAANQLVGDVAPRGRGHRGLRVADHRHRARRRRRAARSPARSPRRGAGGQGSWRWSRRERSRRSIAVVGARRRCGLRVRGGTPPARCGTDSARAHARERRADDGAEPPTELSSASASAPRPWPTRSRWSTPQKASAMRCSPRWRTSRTRRSPSGPPQCAQRPRPSSGSPGCRIVPGLPVGALDDPRDDVLQAAEGRLALALGLGRAEALVGPDLDPAPAAWHAVHPRRRA